uniref:hypothetical protein n=1 Tax=Sinorhizobium psoraleae TaxID=520838 RepID=UPI0035E3D0C2
MFLQQLGELRDRLAEIMAYHASGLDLVVNAITLWNTARFVRDQGIAIRFQD